MLLDQDFGKFKDQNGRYRTLSLFLEYRVNKVPPLWTLKKYELPGNPPSLYLQYLEARDPTEYDFAMAQLGTFEHWEVLQNCNTSQCSNVPNCAIAKSYSVGSLASKYWRYKDGGFPGSSYFFSVHRGGTLLTRYSRNRDRVLY